MALTNKNEFKIVGTLKEALVKLDTNKNGQDWVSTVATIESVVDGHTRTLDVRFFSMAVTKEGKPSALYDTYKKLPELKGKKVQVSGSISENRHWDERTSQMVSYYGLDGRFVNGVADSTTDEASYVVSGFIVSGPTERTNKDNEVYRYDFSVGKKGYACMDKLTLHINKEDRELVKALSELEVGQTVILYGELDFVSQTVQRERKIGFGKPVTETFNNIQKNYYIVNGDVIEGESAYTKEDIKDLIAEYKARDVEKAEAAKANVNTEEAAQPVKKAISQRQASLI